MSQNYWCYIIMKYMYECMKYYNLLYMYEMYEIL